MTKIIFLDKDNEDMWDKFCLSSDDAWYLHSTKFINYTLNYRPDLKPINRSFMIVNENKVLGICPLIEEVNKDGFKEFSFGGVSCIMPAFANDLPNKQKRKIMKLLFQNIDSLAKENNIARVSFRSAVLNKSYVETHSQKYNFLTQFGFFDVSINTHIIDLSKNIDQLRLDVRHGHDSDIAKSEKSLNVEIYGADNITTDIFEKYKHMHFVSAGRKTRPDTTFDLLYDYITQGIGFLVCAKLNDEYVGFSYFVMYKDNVYYGSSCKSNEYNSPINHFIQWQAIKHMKSIGCKFYEIGWQVFGSDLNYSSSDKEVHLSKFKRGFGGYTVPIFAGEKYYDNKYLNKIVEERLKHYLGGLND